MIEILQGNCLDKIKDLEDNSIDCVVSSPPYFGLRDYGTAKWEGGDVNCSHSYGRNTRGGLSDFQKKNKGGFGDEAIKTDENCKLCGAKRIDEQFGLEKTYQDYIANTVKVFETFKPKLKHTATIWWNVGDSYNQRQSSGDRTKNSLKQKTNKGNYGMKIEPQKDLKIKDLIMIPNRVAIALQDAGWYIRSEIIWHKPNPMPESVRDRPTSAHEKIWLITKNKSYYYDHEAIKEEAVSKGSIHVHKSGNKADEYVKQGLKTHPAKTYITPEKRNKRNVWTVTTKPFKEAHFATFPPDLIEPCIKAGCPKDGIVLDPFGGSGTTGLVCKKLGRKAILIELNPDYIKIAKKRIDSILC